MYGHERRTEDRSNDNNELYARMHAIERKNQGGISEPPEPKVMFHPVRGLPGFHMKFAFFRGGIHPLRRSQVLARRLQKFTLQFQQQSFNGRRRHTIQPIVDTQALFSSD